MEKLVSDAESRKARQSERKVVSKLEDLKIINDSKDPKWSYLINTVQD